MDYGHSSDKYSGRHGRSERATKVQKAEAKLQAALAESRRKAIQRAAHAEAKAKAGRGNVGGFLDAIKSIFRRAS